MSKQKLNSIVKGSFNDEKHLQKWQDSGEFPRIHDDVSFLVKLFANEPEASIDLGTSIGILTLRNVKNGRSRCIGIEGNDFDFNRCLTTDKCTYENFFVTEDTLSRLEGIILKNRVTLVTARRVICEIGFEDISVVRSMAKMFAECGVKKIIIQGRVRVGNPSVALWNVDLESEMFYDYYKVTKKGKKDTYLLELK